MKVVFIGATGFGLRCLKHMAGLPCCELVGVVTAPASFKISYRPSGVTNILHADVGSYCDAKGIPWGGLAAGMNDARLFERVQSWKPDAFIVVGWYHMIPASWRSLAPAYGLHASLLPDYSGGAPLVWAIINGEERTGITFFQLWDGVDNGPIVGQVATAIMHEDTIATLYARIEVLGLRLLSKNLPRLADGTAVLRPQDESRRRTFPQRSPEDGLIEWRQLAERARNFVRAQTHPYPGAFTRFRGGRLHIWEARACEPLHAEVAAGEIVLDEGRVIVGCRESALQLLRVSMKGEETPAIEWWRKCNPTAKEHLGA